MKGAERLDWIIDGAEIGQSSGTESSKHTTPSGSISSFEGLEFGLNNFTQSDLGAHFFESHFGQFKVR